MEGISTFAKCMQGICFEGRREIGSAGDREVARSRRRGLAAVEFSSFSSDVIAYPVPRRKSPVPVCSQVHLGRRRVDPNG